MAEYIEREALVLLAYKSGDYGHPAVVDLEDIADIPAADVAPVVRCRECVYRGDYRCPMYHEEYYWDEDDGGDYIPIDNTHDDGFCDLGAKMDGERKDCD